MKLLFLGFSNSWGWKQMIIYVFSQCVFTKQIFDNNVKKRLKYSVYNPLELLLLMGKQHFSFQFSTVKASVSK